MKSVEANVNKYVQPYVSIHIPSWIRRRSMTHWIGTRSSLQSFDSNIDISRTMSRRGESDPKVTLSIRRPHFFLLTTSKSQPRVSPTHQHTPLALSIIELHAHQQVVHLYRNTHNSPQLNNERTHNHTTI
jgi:hypothetical protein